MNQASSTLGSVAHRKGVRALYRAILRTHRRRLPQSMRELGDAFVTKEFQLHKHVRDERVVASFLGRWREYLSTLRTHGPEGEGAGLAEEQVALLSPDQQRQLNRLRTTLFEEKTM